MNLLKTTYNKAETLKGKKLVYTLIAIFFIFLGVGFLIGYLNVGLLNKNETQSALNSIESGAKKDSFTGKISYVNPELYPEDKFSYVLTDREGNNLIFLKADDDKLSIAEGLTAKVTGTKATSQAGNEYLRVEEIVLNAAN